MPFFAGEYVGPYQIVALIGSGGMGDVYRAHDRRLARDVAIKVSTIEFSDRFEREGRAVASLNHSNICQLYDIGALPSGAGYLVMEYIEGERLKGPMALEDALRIARQVAAALEEAHENGIIHRDLKPGNVMVRSDGTVKVLDFGLAKIAGVPGALTEDSPTTVATHSGVILGTAAYMAPEQARGRQVDKRADIWAFGVLLHELLTGRRLFEGEDLAATLAMVLKEQPDLSDVPSEVRARHSRLRDADWNGGHRACGPESVSAVALDSCRFRWRRGHRCVRRILAAAPPATCAANPILTRAAARYAIQQRPERDDAFARWSLRRLRRGGFSGQQRPLAAPNGFVDGAAAAWNRGRQFHVLVA
jgi:serine/threonine protein kinase